MVFESGDRAARSGTTFLAASASPPVSPKTSRPRSGGALDRLRAQLLGGVSGIALPAASMVVALGVGLPTEASAQSSFNGSQATTYFLTTGTQTSPFTFGTAANIGPTAAGTDAVDADALTNWNVTNQGVLKGNRTGIALVSLGTITNAGTITGITGTGVYLTAGGAVTNQATGVIGGGGGSDGVHVNGVVGTVINAGTITSGPSGTSGVYLGGGGTVTNQAGGSISSNYNSVAILAGGTVINFGNITGTHGSGVYLGAGGNVTNQAGGAIDGGTNGVHVKGTAGTVTNDGTINGTNSAAVLLQAGGSVTNNTGRTISGGSSGVEIAGAAGTVTNAGIITGKYTYGVILRNGGTVTNQAAGLISGGNVGVNVTGSAGAVTNAGTITGTGSGAYGVYLGSGGSVTNQAGGVITGIDNGVVIRNVAATVTNAGTITGTAAYGVFFQSGGGITNQAGGVISGGATGIITNSVVGSVTNAGTIKGTTNKGVYLRVGGSVTNQAGATISGGNYGVFVGFSAGTVTNAGTITGASSSVLFLGTGANTLTLQTGSVLNGTATGSTTGAATNALILQGAGTANNNFVHFNTLDVQASGTWTLGGAASLSSTALVESGTLSVTGNLTSANTLTVNSGGALAGTGTVATTSGVFINGGAAVHGGLPGAVGTLNVNGNLTFNSGGILSTTITPQAASLVHVGGLAALTGGTVQVTAASFFTHSQTLAILTATTTISSAFSSVSMAPTAFASNPRLSYDAHDVFLTVDAGSFVGLLPPSGSVNQVNVAKAIDAAIAAGGIPPAGFAVLGSLPPASFLNGLTQLSGETATGSQQTTFQAMTQFLGTLLDPFIGGRGGETAGNAGATPFAEEFDSVNAYAADASKRSKRERDAYGMFTKAPLAQAYDPRWSVWAAGFGGSQTTDGNATLGSNTATSRLGAVAVGADYRFSPFTIAGFALAGGGTNFSVANAGSGRSDLFQAGAFVRHTVGPAYISGALAYGWQDVTTDRTVTVTGIDQLRAKFNANAFSGRIEGGYRFVTPWVGGIGFTPYAAGQFTAFDLPAYAEQAIVGSNQFALAFAAKSVTDTRSELGIRTDKSWAMQTAILTLRGRLAWAHDFNPDRNIAATFQSLPGASFVVGGAAQAHESALTTASAELKWQNGWSAAAAFEGEFSNVTRSYAGKGVVRYTW